MDATSGSLLNNPRFLRLWIGQACSFVGDAVSMVALVILVVQLTGSAAAVGGVLVARLLPTIASPLVGVYADRLDRRRVLVASDLVRAIIVLAMVFTRELVVLLVLVFLMGLARAFFNPTIRAAFPGVVGGGDLTRANAFVSGTFSVSVTLGPALGGLLVATVGVGAASALDAATFLVSALLLSRIPMPRPASDDDEAGFGRELKEGFKFLAGTRVPLAVVAGAFLTMLTINLTVPAEVFLAKRTFGTGDAGYGLLVAVWGGGMVLGSALMAVLGGRIGALPFYFASIFVAAVGLAGTGLAPTFVLALGALAVAGIANGIDDVAASTVIQERVPDAFLGRVFSLNFFGLSAGEVLAYLAGGALADAAGPRFTYLLAATATAAAGLLVVLLAVTRVANVRGR
ncbi:MAG: MFS transporter [Actinomycetota bacterium]|nr:MFS transporter [Actinomycetota bacterium]